MCCTLARRPFTSVSSPTRKTIKTCSLSLEVCDSCELNVSYLLTLLEEPKPKPPNTNASQPKKPVNAKNNSDAPSDFLDGIIDGIVALGRERDQLQPRPALLPAWSPRALVKPPRILVCAPSNAAVDEILARIVSEGFLDSTEKMFRPHVMRVGHSPKYAPWIDRLLAIARF